MIKSRLQLLLVILIGVITGCAGTLNIVPEIPAIQPSNMVVENPTENMDEQFRLREPKYKISLPQNKMLHKSLYLKDKGIIYLWLFENNQYELAAIDLNNSKVLWTFKLPKRAVVYGMGKTESDDIYLDLNHGGIALIFIDPEQGIEKWRHGKGAKEGDTGFCKYFNRKFNFLVKADSIIVQDATTYQTLNKINRFKMDPDRVNGGHTRFYNLHVWEIDNQYIIMDNGMHAVSMESGQTLWSSRFPTIATRYHTGKNVGLAVVGALVGAYGGGRGPDYYFPSPLVIKANGSYFVSALSNLYRINPTTGNIEWAYDLGIGSASSISISEDQIYLASCGGYTSGIYCFEQEKGSQDTSFQTPYSPSVDAEALSPEKLKVLSENEMWERNLACYNAVIKKETIVSSDKYIYYPVIQTKEEILILTNAAINAVDKQNGHTSKSLQNPSFGCNTFERIMLHGESQILALSKNEIAAINIEDFSLAWKFNPDWSIDHINKFQINLISSEHLYVRAIVDKKIKGYILRKDTGEMISNFEADQSLQGADHLAVKIDNGIFIYQ